MRGSTKQEQTQEMNDTRSIYKLQRALHKQRARDIRSYLLSIKQDSEFVLDVASAYGLPVLGNLRNGLWYVPPSFLSGKCYFKSTDGHDGQWTMSTTRLNLNVAEIAAECGGCIVVDSTRSGKLYPDALSATVPIWCAVINRIVFPARPPTFHGPEWMPASSKHIIQSSIDSWVESIPGATRTMIQQHLTEKLNNPLVPVWVCPSNFQPHQTPHLPDDCTPVVLVSASKVISSEAAREHHSWVYVQGAGDDEENWALGLMPQLFWDNIESILSSDDPADVQAMVEEVVRLNKTSGSNTARDQKTEAQPEHWWLGSTGICVASRQSKLAQQLQEEQQQAAQNDRFTGVCTLLPHALRVVAEREDTEGSRSARSTEEPGLPLWCELDLAQDKRAHPREYWAETLIPAVMRFYEACRAQHQLLEQPGVPKVVFLCETGQDASVVMATAVLCKFFRADGSSMEPLTPEDSPESLSKSSIRQRLMFIQFYHPMAQPPRRLLKELNNYFFGPQSSSS